MQPAQILPPSNKQFEINPPPKGLVGSTPAPQEAATSVSLPASEDNHTQTLSVRTEPPLSRLSNLPGLQKLKDSLLVSPTSKQTTIEDVRHSTSPDRPPEGTGQPEIAPQRQSSDDSVRSDEAVFGDTRNAVDNTIRPAPNRLPKSPVESPNVEKAPVQPTLVQIPLVRIAPVQTTLDLNTPIQVQHPLANQIEKKVESTNLEIPGPTPARPKGTPLLSPGMLSPPLTPSPRNELLGLQNAQQNTPLVPANLFLSPGPAIVVPALSVPPLPMPTTPTTPDTPIMPATPIKHQSSIPGVIGQTPNVLVNQPPMFLARSPRRPPPPGLVPVSTVAGEKNFGVIGDRRVTKNQPQPQTPGESKDRPKNREDVWLAKPEPASKFNGAQDPEVRDWAKPQPIGEYPEPIYVGGQKHYVGRHLGGGAMGKVYSVVSKNTMCLNALKVIARKRLDSVEFSTVKGEWNALKAISEAKFLYGRRSEGLRFVHHLVESWFDKDNIYFVMVSSVGFITSLVINEESLQPLSVGSLRDHLREVRFDPLTTRVYAAELVRRLDSDSLTGITLKRSFLQMSGLEALHDMRIMHCDLKPDNILVCPDGHLSIADFGLSVSWLDPRYSDHPSHAFRGRRLAGTDGYMAPELISVIQNPERTTRGNFGFAADIWSMGVIIAELGMRGRRLVSYEDDRERERWGDDYKSFSRALVVSPEKLIRRVERYLRGDHAMLVERVSVIFKADPREREC